MKKSLLLLLLLFCIKLSAQVVGTVTSKENQPLAVVNIFVENTRKGTTTNNDGYYQLDIKNTGNYTIVFQYLGFKTLKACV